MFCNELQREKEKEREREKKNDKETNRKREEKQLKEEQQRKRKKKRQREIKNISYYIGNSLCNFFLIKEKSKKKLYFIFIDKKKTLFQHKSFLKMVLTVQDIMSSDCNECLS